MVAQDRESFDRAPARVNARAHPKPPRAITEKGHDKKKCLEYLFVGQRAALAELGRDQGYIGDYLGCGLCLTGVPCEQRIPLDADQTG
jgi:hypothetical protein